MVRIKNFLLVIQFSYQLLYSTLPMANEYVKGLSYLNNKYVIWPV